MLTVDVDRKIEEQITRRGEIETLRSLCDGVSVQVAEVRQKLGGVTQAQAKLLPVAEQVTSLKQAVDKAEARISSALRDETELSGQERRIADMLQTVRELAGLAEMRMTQAQGLTDALGRSEKMKDGLLQELSVVQGRHRADVLSLRAGRAHRAHTRDRGTARRNPGPPARRRRGAPPGRYRSGPIRASVTSC